MNQWCCTHRVPFPGARAGSSCRVRGTRAALMGADARRMPQQLRLPVAPCAEHLPVASQRWAPSLPRTQGPLQTRLKGERLASQLAASPHFWASLDTAEESWVCAVCLTPLSQVQSSVSYQMWQAPGKQPQAFGCNLFQAQLGSIKLNNSSCNN